MNVKWILGAEGMKALKKVAVLFTTVIFTLSCAYTPSRAAVTAAPTSSPVFVNGKLVPFQAYFIGGNNYFKLRDIAMVLSGTAKQFDVEYDAATDSIALRSNKPYSPVGGELAVTGVSTSVTAKRMTSGVYLDGNEIALAAYTINDSNYFKLRDIGAAIDFGVIWDGPSKLIKIDSSISYVEDSSIPTQYIVADHTCIKLDQIPMQWIEKARTDLHIAYGHTSHGSQIITGMKGLTSFKGSPYIYNSDLSGGSIDLRDTPFSITYMDLGQPDSTKWASETRTYLNSHKDINVVMWSWCGQLQTANTKYVNAYLSLMQKLESEYPDVTFVYWTDTLDGTGVNGTLNKNNNIIRQFCIDNNKVLYDFADIESYNPDGVCFLDKCATDACAYDSNGDNKTDKNWAVEWQNAHTKGIDWFDCQSAHSQPVNANMKAYAAWWLMARLAGWNGTNSSGTEG